MAVVDPPLQRAVEPLSPNALPLLADLPNELLGNIFGFCVPQTIAEINLNLTWSTPIQLSLVCRKWRDIVDACPQLWSVLSLTRAHMQISKQGRAKDVPQMEENERCDVVLGKIERYMHRSRVCPLAVDIRLQGCTDDDLDVIQPILALIIGGHSGLEGTRRHHSNHVYRHLCIPDRLRDLSISLEHSLSIPRDIPLRAEVSFPLLRTVNIFYERDICNPGYAFAAPIAFLAELPSRSPHLRSLSWRGSDSSRVTELLFQEPPTNLTHIEIESRIVSSDAFALLSSFPLLQHCSLNRLEEYRFGVVPVRREEDLRLEHLETLKLSALSLPFLLLAKLTAPRIKHLSLSTSAYYAPQDFSRFGFNSIVSAFLERSTCHEHRTQSQSESHAQLSPEPATHLTQLVLAGIQLSTDDYEELFRLMPALEVLQYHFDFGLRHLANKTHSLLEALARPHIDAAGASSSSSSGLDPTTSILCPRLRLLIIGGGMTAPDGLLSNVVKMRVQTSDGRGVDPKSALEEVSIVLFKSVHQIDWEVLERLRSSAEAVGKRLIMRIREIA